MQTYREPQAGEIWIPKDRESEFVKIGECVYQVTVKILFVWWGCTGPLEVFYHENFTGFSNCSSFSEFMKDYRFLRSGREKKSPGVEITEQDELIFSALRKMLHNGGRWMREDDMGYNLPTFICCRNEKRLCPQELRLACEFWPSAGGIIFDRKEDAEKAIASFSAEEHEALVESFLKA